MKFEMPGAAGRKRGRVISSPRGCWTSAVLAGDSQQGHHVVCSGCGGHRSFPFHRPWCELDIAFGCDETSEQFRPRLDQQSIRLRGVLIREREPVQEVARLRFSQISAVMQAASNGRQIFQPDLRVVRLGFEYRPPLIPRKRPPIRILPNRNQDRAIRLVSVASSDKSQDQRAG